ncbi:hypothetical protein C5B94_08070 [Clavibacter michiganensis]|uniref:DUF3892 domain-containing protein n=1 Tax=Clavibacter michiganensis TaxID=28447 RepID=UPI000CE87A02|nr:DUF3892 domain-containing protein [Clavibacter michiganensis]PPF54302.1 hypothetical protein C5B94_08070 [Clavibacter michiganensis]
MARYIRRISTAWPESRNEHIQEVQRSTSPGGTLTRESVASVAANIQAGIAYRSHNASTGAEATVVRRVSAGGRPYIATVANSRETDNLLTLPRY